MSTKTGKYFAISLAVLAAGITMGNATTYLTTVGSSVAAYDFNLSGGYTHVAYESGGNVYYTEQAFNTTAWSAPVLLGAGTGPSITLSAGTPYVSYLNGGTVNVSTFSGSWTSTDLGTGAERANIRTDSAGTVHLLSSVTSGYGSINYTQNSGAGWSANTNLASGWYGSGSGNYYHQAVMTTSLNAAGYNFIFDFQNWGGRVSWSSESIESSGLPGWPSPGLGWNSGIAIGAGGLSIAANGKIMAGYVNGGTGFVQAYDGAAWTATNLGAASDVSVLSDAAGGNFAYFVSGGNIMRSFNGGAAEAVLVDGTAASGLNPSFAYVDAEKSQLFYRDSVTNNLMSYSVPEPGTFGMLAMWGTLIAFMRRQRTQIPL
jgi:hypothetical protein